MAKTLLISRVHIRSEEVERQVQDVVCLRWGIEQASDDSACVELRVCHHKSENRRGLCSLGYVVLNNVILCFWWP